MTEKSSLEDDLFKTDQPEVVFEEDQVSTNERDDEAFLRDVLGPAAEEALKKEGQRPAQERYDPKKPKAPKAYVTSGGKEIKLEQDFYGKWTIHFSPGGELPKELQGQFTREDLAHEAIQVYLAKRKAAEQQDS